MSKLRPGLVLKSGIYSASKTVNAVRSSKNYNKFKQINIFNQPTGHTHIMIKTAEDLVAILKDIYDYHLYYTSYDEINANLELYKETLSNHINNIKTLENAKNIKYIENPIQRFKESIKIYLGITRICNLNIEQIKKEINHIELNYLPKRQVYINKYGDDLITGIFNYISLDEAPIYFGARSWEKNFSGKNEFLKEFIAYPVKLNCRLEPIAQNAEGLDKNFRRQASIGIRHESVFFGLFQKTKTLNLEDVEDGKISSAEVMSVSTRFNWYDVFGIPKEQYSRNHLICPTDPNIYTKGGYFRYIKKLTEEKKQLK